MNRRRVLLIESHPELRKALRRIFCASECEAVDEATDIVEGVYLSISRQPTMIILDTAISELNAVTFSEIIRRLAPGNQVVLLVDDTHDYDSLVAGYQMVCVNKRTLVHDLSPVLHRWLGEENHERSMEDIA
ncbi:MAG TPA: response regulator [Anaerolineae bacterium]|jgi:DNA-binding NarL/FixJ family response regulator